MDISETYYENAAYKNSPSEMISTRFGTWQQELRKKISSVTKRSDMSHVASYLDTEAKKGTKRLTFLHMYVFSDPTLKPNNEARTSD